MLTFAHHVRPSRIQLLFLWAGWFVIWGTLPPAVALAQVLLSTTEDTGGGRVTQRHPIRCSLQKFHLEQLTGQSCKPPDCCCHRIFTALADVYPLVQLILLSPVHAITATPSPCPEYILHHRFYLKEIKSVVVCHQECWKIHLLCTRHCTQEPVRCCWSLPPHPCRQVQNILIKCLVL